MLQYFSTFCFLSTITFAFFISDSFAQCSSCSSVSLSATQTSCSKVFEKSSPHSYFQKSKIKEGKICSFYVEVFDTGTGLPLAGRKIVALANYGTSLALEPSCFREESTIATTNSAGRAKVTFPWNPYSCIYSILDISSGDCKSSLRLNVTDVPTATKRLACSSAAHEFVIVNQCDN